MPVQTVTNKRRIHGIAAIVARPVRHVAYEFFRRASRASEFGIDGLADTLGHFEIWQSAVAPDKVGATNLAAFDRGVDRAAMIGYMQPVAHLETVAVDRQLAILDGAEDHQRNKFFRKTAMFRNYSPS